MEFLLQIKGRDATEEFNMLHKPDVIEKYAPECIIGKISGPAPAQEKHSSNSKPVSSSPKNTQVASTTRQPSIQLSPSDTESKTSGGTAKILPQVSSKL